MTGPQAAAGVWLYWIPLGAGHHSVRLNGVVYEAVSATLQHRPRRDLYHSALEIMVPSGRYMVEMTPVPDGDGSRRGVVAVGPVGVRSAGRLRWFRYEVRRWRDGVVPDLAYSVTAPIHITDDVAVAQAVFDAVPHVPRFTWGRDEAGVGEMWTCNSIVSWTLARGEVDAESVPMAPAGRAPGWDAGTRHSKRARGASYFR